MNSAKGSTSTPNNGLHIEAVVQKLMKKADTARFGSPAKSVTPEEKPKEPQVYKRKANDERPGSPSLSEKKCRTALPEASINQCVTTQNLKKKSTQHPLLPSNPADKSVKQEVLPPKNEQLYQCQWDDCAHEIFKNVQEFYKHVNGHPTAYKSPVIGFKCEWVGCAYVSRQCSDLIIHLYTHTGEKPQSCTYCPQKFAQKSTLNRHMQIHTNEKPFTCDLCGYACKRSGNLKVHILSSKHIQATKAECIPSVKDLQSGSITALNQPSKLPKTDPEITIKTVNE